MRARPFVVPLLAALVLLAAARPAPASYDPISGGATRLTLDKRFVASLKEHHVQLLAAAPLRIRGSIVTLPVSSGMVDPVAARGPVEHEGALIFKAGRRKLPMRGLILKTTQAHSPLAAKFGGGKLKLASAARLRNARAGFGLRSTVSSMLLSQKVAVRLDKKLHLRGVFKQGQPFGSSVTNAQPATTAIVASGRVALVPTPAFLAKLRQLFVSLNPIAPAELAAGPVLTLPIFGGNLAPGASTGTLTTEGSLEFLQLGGGQIFWQAPSLDFGLHLAGAEVDLEPSPPYPGKLGPIGILDLGAGVVSSEPGERKISVANATLTMQPATAAAFNEAFAKPQGKQDVFVPGEEVGSVSFTAQGQ
jgi:hypothetical protein